MTVDFRTGAAGLTVERLTVRYSGTVAVDRLDLGAPCGRITGLIGPNGAGKTTTFNACSGFVTPAEGRIHLFGADVTRLGPAQRARRGLGRTFQRMELIHAMTVAENLVTARDARAAGANPLRQVFTGRAERQRTGEAVDEALERCGLMPLAGRPVASLSTGERRLVELARACVSDFRLLLLDEPSSGLDPSETEQFGAVLRTLVEERGVGILLVEHDMALVMSVCQYLYVLDFGVLIAEGSPHQVQANPVVRAAYLGDDVGVGDHIGLEVGPR
jgi:ABC-type branched-subunit amino acid transport system ATPase component